MRYQKYKLLFYILGSFFLTSCSSMERNVKWEEPGVIEEGTYNLQSKTQKLPDDLFQRKETKSLLVPGDMVAITIFDNPDLSRKRVPVAPDGRIYYLLMDPVQAENRSLDEISKEMERNLEKYIVDPKVSIHLKEFASRRYVVLGKVAYPGTFEIKSNLTLREAIAQTGGFTQGRFRGDTIELANLKGAFITRKDKGLIPVDFVQLVKQGDNKQNILIQPNDYIYIPSALNQEVYILGAVKQSRSIGYTEGMTLVKLISGSPEVGSYTDEALLTHVVILRDTLSQTEAIVINFNKIINGQTKDIFLEPGDIVYIPNKPFRFLKDLVKGATETFLKTYGAKAASRYFYVKEEK